jgi:hypothetical protein
MYTSAPSSAETHLQMPTMHLTPHQHAKHHESGLHWQTDQTVQVQHII